MRYLINFDKAVNRLTPHYLGGRKLILFLQSTVHPLKSVNVSFAQYAVDTRLDASMTSQPIIFEKYLNKRVGSFFLNPNESIRIRSYSPKGVPIYHQYAVDDEKNILLYKQNEELPSGTENVFLKREFEKKDDSGGGAQELRVSFVVESPAIDMSKEDEYRSLLSYYINKYKLFGKTYEIIIDKG